MLTPTSSCRIRVVDREPRLPIQSLLQPTEKLLSEFPPFYATSYRVIRLSEAAAPTPRRDWWTLLSWGKPPPAPPPLLLELPYSQITGVERVDEARHPMMAAGTGMIILGLLLLVIPFVTGVLAIAVGVGLLAAGAKGQLAYYQIQARNLPPEQAQFWRIPYAGSGSFVATVRQVIGQFPEF